MHVHHVVFGHMCPEPAPEGQRDFVEFSLLGKVPNRPSALLLDLLPGMDACLAPAWSVIISRRHVDLHAMWLKGMCHRRKGKTWASGTWRKGGDDVKHTHVSVQAVAFHPAVQHKHRPAHVP
jgi:hypothetical protein